MDGVGFFSPFEQRSDVRCVGIEANHSAPLSSGSVGVFNGALTYVLQEEGGQFREDRLGDLGVGPQLAQWKETKHVEFSTVSDEDAIAATRILRETEGWTLSQADAPAIWKAVQLAKAMDKNSSVVVCINGDANKDRKY